MLQKKYEIYKGPSDHTFLSKSHYLNALERLSSDRMIVGLTPAFGEAPSKKWSNLFINWGTTVNAEVPHDVAKSLKLLSGGDRWENFPTQGGKTFPPWVRKFPLCLLRLEASKRQIRHLQIIPKALGMVPVGLIEKHEQGRKSFSERLSCYVISKIDFEL